MLDAVNVVGIASAQDVPAVREKPCGHIFGEGEVGVPFDGDVIVVPDSVLCFRY